MSTFNNNSQFYNSYDDYNTSLISITGDASVPEGGTAKYTVSLTEPLDNILVVNIIYTLKDVDKGEIIEETKEVYLYPGETEVSFTVSNVDDDVYEGEEVYNVGIDGFQEIIPMAMGMGDSYTLVKVNPEMQNVDTVIIDNEPNPTPAEPILVSIDGDASVAEGDKANYTVSLEKPALVPVVVDIVYTLKDVDTGEIIEKTKEVKFEAGWCNCWL